MGKLNGKVALITGGTSGIGLATATLFKQEGARIIVTGRDAKALALAEQTLGEGAVAIRSDAGKLAEVAQLLDTVKDRFGGIDVLVLNAGLAPFRPFDGIDEAFVDHVIGVDFKGPFFTIQKALPLLKSGASIVLITSIVANIGFPQGAIYGAAKAALGSLARSLSAELVGRGIRINSISPGPIDTPIFQRTGVPREMLDGILEQMRTTIPMRRLGEASELAKAILFLASSDSSFILGEEIAVDGGMSHVRL
jgi:NAD(P)-dependent dehydrogenase (short-subunit alcohol dehydrogenase family)